MSETSPTPPAGLPPRIEAANSALAEGRLSDAVGDLIAALEERPGLPIKVYRVLVSTLLRLSRPGEAMQWATKALSQVPDDTEIHNFIGIMLNMRGRCAEAIGAFDHVLTIDPEHRGALNNKGHALNHLQQGAAAETIFRRLLTNKNAAPDLHRGLAKALWVQGNLPAAGTSYRNAIKISPHNVDSWLDLSALTADMGDPAGGVEILDSALMAVPGDGRLVEAKSVMLRRAGLIDRLGPYLEAMADPFAAFGWYQHELGLFTSRFDRQTANRALRKAIALAPENGQYKTSLVGNLIRTRGVDEGAYLDEAHGILSAQPLEQQRASSNIAAETFLFAADYDALESLGGITALGQDWARTDHHSSFLLQFGRVAGDEDRREIIRQHRAWGSRAMARAVRHPISMPSSRSPSSKTRIGFMSSDLREHPVAHFAWPLFEHVDRDRFELYCYSFYQSGRPTPMQERIASMVDVFRWNPFITDHDAAQMIADDQLDILFELGGSTHMNKIEVMAWKPARLCASWMGYPHSSGLTSIDYLLVDPFINPPDSSLLIEKPLVMPHNWIAMSERAFPDDHAANKQAPVGRHGFITFGTANSPYKYNPATLRTWARTMAQVAGSRFLFVRPEGSSRIFQDNIRARFEAEGVAGDRIEFRAVRGSHMPHYNDIDIALDTFPQTGGTTTCEALWMGVPTISLIGEALFERQSYSILANAGLGDLCAATLDQFVNIAVALAGETDRLHALRAGLREQVRASPLGQTERFAQDFYDLVAATVR
jgi:protein O-GlcNAc transferase